MFKNKYELDGCTIASGKLAVAAFIIVVLKLWGSAMTWVHNTNIWWFVAALVVFSIRPLTKVKCKKNKKK